MLPKPRSVEGKTVKGVNFFDPVDNALLHALQNPKVNIAGVRRADLAPMLDQLSPSRLSPVNSDACAKSASSKKSSGAIAIT